MISCQGRSAPQTSFSGSCPVKPGHYYYVDLHELPDDSDKTWTLGEVSQSYGSTNARFDRAWGNFNEGQEGLVHGTVQMSINEDLSDAYKLLVGRHGTYWSVEFKHAADPDELHNIY